MDAEARTTETTPRKPLPDDTGRTLGPGHIDMVHERIDQAIGIAKMMYAGIGDLGNLPDGGEDAAWGQQRLLEEAIEHLNEYTRERAEQARRPQAVESAPPPTDQGSILDFEEPIRMAKGQAAAIYAALGDRGDDELIGAAEALDRQLYALHRQWGEMVEARRQAKERAAS